MKYLIALLFTVGATASLWGQQDQFNWRLGAYGGLMVYYGDLTDEYRLLQPTRKTIQPLDNIDFETYGLSLEGRLSNAFSLGFLYSHGNFLANDRAINWDNELQLEQPFFGRSLNAKTEIDNYTLYLTFHFDNDRILSRDAFFAPYLKAGVGLTDFVVRGDLYHGPRQDQRYYYWPDGTIRDLPPDNEQATIIEQDGRYETNLTALNTEGEDYETAVFTPVAGLGLKFRVLDRLNLNLEYLWHFTQTDYLDDVSGQFPESVEDPQRAYAANPADWPGPERGSREGNDLYHFASVSLHYNFGRRREAFFAPAIRTGELPLPGEAAYRGAVDSAAPADTVASAPIDTTRTLEPVAIPDTAATGSREQRPAADTLTPQPERLDTTILTTMPVPAEGDTVGRTDTLLREAEPAREAPNIDTTTTDTASMIITAPDTTAGDTVITDSVGLDPAPIDTSPAPADTLRSGLPETPLPPTAAPDTSRLPAGAPTGQDVAALYRRLNMRDSLLSEQYLATNRQLNQLQETVDQLRLQLQRTDARPEVRDTVDYQQYQGEIDALRQSLNATIAQLQSDLTDEELSDEAYLDAVSRLQRQLNALPVTPQVSAYSPSDSLQRATNQRVEALSNQVDYLQSLLLEGYLQKEASPPTDTATREQLQLDPEILQLREQLRQQQLEREQARTKAERSREEALRQMMKQNQRATEQLNAKIDSLESRLTRAKQPAATAEPAPVATEQSSIYFNTGSAELTPMAKDIALGFARALFRNPKLGIRLNGYADPRGNAQQNIELARQRVQAVKNYLEQLDVSANRIFVGTIGIDFNAESLQKGRRVTLQTVGR